MADYNYFNNKSSEDIMFMKSIIDNQEPFSLGFLDWFFIKETIINELHLIFIKDFNDNVKQYGKKDFDPFRRSGRFNFNLVNHNIILDTSPGQLNFFKWCFNNKVFEFITTNWNILYKAYKKFLL
jgi:hypothetical protein